MGGSSFVFQSKHLEKILNFRRKKITIKLNSRRKKISKITLSEEKNKL